MHSAGLGAGPLALKCPRTSGRLINPKEIKRMYMNQLTIIGFTGQDAELHYTQNGTPVTTLSRWLPRNPGRTIKANGKAALSGTA
jgi:hypothetical protein